MRIIYDHQATSLQDEGGISRYYYQLVKGLLGKSEIDISLLLGLNHSIYPYRDLASRHCRIVSLRSPILKTGHFRYLVNDVISNAAASISGKFDVYHATVHRCLPLVRSNAIVATHHDFTQERFPSMFAHMATRRRIKTKQFARVDAIICVSEHSRNDLLRFYEVQPEKTHVIHLGITKMESGDLPKTMTAKSPYILYVGSRMFYKNFLGFLRAFRISRLDKDFSILCAGGGNFSAEESKVIQDEGLEARITLFPRVSERELGALYSHAHLLVYPSKSEGFGIPPLEAMSMGVVPAVSNATSIPEVCQDAAIYFDPYSMDSMVNALQRACYDTSMREDVRQKGKIVTARYSWEKCARETLEVYRSLG